MNKGDRVGTNGLARMSIRKRDKDGHSAAKTVMSHKRRRQEISGDFTTKIYFHRSNYDEK